MKFKCGDSRGERLAKQKAKAEEDVLFYRNWHDHYAWLPCRVGSGDCRWLEMVERRYPDAWVFLDLDEVFFEKYVIHPGYSGTEYRPKQPKAG